MKSCLFSLTVIASLTIAGCGGGGSNNNTKTGTTYTIGGTVSDLFGSGLVLQNNGGNNLAVITNGSFSFSTAIASGSAYIVTVLTQPGSPAQSCTVKNGSGTANANVSNVLIACSGSSEWVWMGGPDTTNQPGGYGTLGTAAAGNIPGARFDATTWTDNTGNFWLFGGDGYDSTGAAGRLNDLWKYSPTSGEWTWVNGANVVNKEGSYGTQGTAASSNIPGARFGAGTWTDASGNLWLFGGYGYDSTGAEGDLNDLWKYSAGGWTWKGGSSTRSHGGTYGTQGTAASNNIPGARELGVSWTDKSGNFWLFGGSGYDSTGTEGALNDVWMYNTSSGEWTWVGGAAVVNQIGIYGTLGTAASSNIPGARGGASRWTDASRNLWLFGGAPYSTGGATNAFNDLWEYSTSTGEWTWMSGADVVNQNGIYGTLGTAASTNVPGARAGGATWTDASGNFWLFGGEGYDSTGTNCTQPAPCNLNDLWKYSGGQWTWMGGSETGGQTGSYGTLGTASSSSVPGGLILGSSWVDEAGNFWLFGGVAIVNNTQSGAEASNSLWEYQP
jgi:N-acetylneuraminic acid mutarotase